MGLFGYFETPRSFSDALDGISHEEVKDRWQQVMAPSFEGTGLQADQTMEELVEVFHLD